jgi:DNA-binding NtrC family response regulator
MTITRDLVTSGAEAVVVDDVPSAMKIMARFLTRMGFSKVYQCNSTEQAFRTITNHRRIQVLLSDVVMPGESGYDLVKRLETLEREKPLIIILTTSGSSETVKAGSYRTVILEPLRKPFSREELERRLNDWHE